MKINAPQVRGVESMGRGDASALGAVANAKSQLSSTQKQVASYMAKLSADYIERKENAEFNSGKINTMVQFDELHKTLATKTAYTASELKGLPTDSIKLKNADGSERKNIPAFEATALLLDQGQQKIIKQQEGEITNPHLKESYRNLALGIASSNSLKATIKASDEQKKYYMAKDKNDAQQLALAGQRVAAQKVIEENPDYTALEREVLSRDVNKTWEWELDTRVLNTNDMPSIVERYQHLRSKEYGKGEKDYLESGAPSGRFNVESNIKRFESTIKELKGKQDLSSQRETEELIRALADGNDKANPLTKPEGGYRQYINELGLNANKTDLLMRKAEVAESEGRGRNMTLGTTFKEDDSIEGEAVRILSNTEAEFHDEAKSYLKGIAEASDYKKKELMEDASSYLEKHNPLIQGAIEKFKNEKIPNLKAAYFDDYLTASRAVQERTGLLPSEVNFMTRTDVDEFKKDAAKRGSISAQKVIDQIVKLKAQYGQEYTAVYMQLIREGALRPEHIVMDNIEDQGLQITYADALRREEDLKKTQTYKENITQVKRDTEDAIRVFKSTSIQSGSFPNAAKGLTVDDQYNALTNGIVQIVMTRIDEVGKYDADDVKKIVNQITQDKWETDGFVRIPRLKMENGRPVQQNTEKVVRGLQVLRNGAVASPDLRFYIAPIQGVSPEDQQEIMRNEFNNFSVAITNDNETGVNFKTGDGRIVMVVRNGRAVPLEISFDELEVAGVREYRKTGTGAGRSIKPKTWVIK